MDIYLYNTGDFKHRVEIQEAKTIKVNGRPVVNWESILETRAKTFKDNKVTTTEAEQGDTDKIVKRILIRTPKSFELTSDYRIIYKGKPYKIKGLNDIKDAGVYTELTIERVE